MLERSQGFLGVWRDARPAETNTLACYRFAVSPAYPYVGPAAIRRAVEGAPAGACIRSQADLEAWLQQTPSALDEGATFTVSLDGLLHLAPRRSEHVACAAGKPVLSAGEMRFAWKKPQPAVVTEVTNQSTGYCPEPSSFEDVAQALCTAGLPAPPTWSWACVFRRCPGCEQLNLVKNDDFTCEACWGALPRERNL